MAFSTLFSSVAKTITLVSMKAFDAHNHVHLSLPGGVPPLEFGTENPSTSSYESSVRIRDHAREVTFSLLGDSPDQRGGDSSNHSKTTIHLYGCALMSTQPRDFPVVDEICNALDVKQSEKKIRNSDNLAFPVADSYSMNVRCYGVHPWFLHIADDDFQNLPNDHDHDHDNDNEKLYNDEKDFGYSKEMAERNSLNWFPYLRQKLMMNPKACVGEIGLDGARYDPTTKKTPSSMERQIQAFEVQMHLAAELKRPVSIHAVKAWGPIADTFRRIKKSREIIVGRNKKERTERQRQLETQGIYESPSLLPPKIYFHAFGGKAPIVDQLDSLCKNVSETFYGFAPVINFRSPKTAEVIRKVGISRLVLETDLEDHTAVRDNINLCVQFVSEVLCIEEEEVLKKTTENAMRLYDLKES